VKYESYSQYDPVGVAFAESACLTVWAALGAWHDDLVYTLLHYDRGTNAALAGFGEEVRVGNPACPDVVVCLGHHFRDEQASAPVRAANFVLGQSVPGESEDLRFRRRQIQQDMVNAGRLLQKATPA